jgi:hypothetical protein
MAVLLAVINVWPLLDVGLDPTAPDHVELPAGESGMHHSAHDHSLCGVMATAHVLPVEPAGVTLAIRSIRVAPPFVPSGLPTALTFSAHRSRAPPSA